MLAGLFHQNPLDREGLVWKLSFEWMMGLDGPTADNAQKDETPDAATSDASNSEEEVDIGDIL